MSLWNRQHSADLFKRESKEKDKGRDDERSSWFQFRTKERFLKDQWLDWLSKKLDLNEMHILLVNEFLERYGLIFAGDSSELDVILPFALNRRDDFVYIQVPQKYKGKEHDVQYTIRILE